MSSIKRHLICGIVALTVFVISGLIAMQFMDNEGFWSTNIVIAAVVCALIVETITNVILKRKYRDDE